jgi:hypothetical protein
MQDQWQLLNGKWVEGDKQLMHATSKAVDLPAAVYLATGSGDGERRVHAWPRTIQEQVP